MQVKGQKSEILGSSNKTRGNKNRKGKSKGSIELANF